MPIIDFIHYKENTKIIIWDVTESDEELLELLELNDKRIQKYKSMPGKQAREYLGLRACLKEFGLNYDVLYDDKGKPYLPTNHQISITHSYGKVGLGVSSKSLGIDIEKNRPNKILNICSKFIREDEAQWIPQNEDFSEYLHIIWGIKEGLYKLNGGNLWNFLHHYRVEPFYLIQNQPIVCWISDEVKSRKYYANYKIIDDSFLVWVVD